MIVNLLTNDTCLHTNFKDNEKQQKQNDFESVHAWLGNIQLTLNNDKNDFALHEKLKYQLHFFLRNG